MDTLDHCPVEFEVSGSDLGKKASPKWIFGNNDYVRENIAASIWI